jgi:hypothetical protein
VGRVVRVEMKISIMRSLEGGLSMMGGIRMGERIKI